METEYVYYRYPQLDKETIQKNEFPMRSLVQKYCSDVHGISIGNRDWYNSTAAMCLFSDPDHNYTAEGFHIWLRHIMGIEFKWIPLEESDDLYHDSTCYRCTWAIKQTETFSALLLVLPTGHTT